MLCHSDGALRLQALNAQLPAAQVRVPPEGARLLVASDGVWDAFQKTSRVASIARSAPTQV